MYISSGQLHVTVVMETKPAPECQCGNGLKLLRKAGDRSTRPGEFYYICSASLNHRNKFFWYDEYQGNNVIHKSSISMEYTSGSSNGTKLTCIIAKVCNPPPDTGTFI